MSEQILVISGSLPGLNKIIAAAKSGRGNGNAYSRLKKSTEQKISMAIIEQKIKPMDSIWVDFLWVEKNRRRDPDNIAAARKFIFDAMVHVGVIDNDGWSQISGWSDMFCVSSHPCVILTIRSRNV